MAKEDEKVTKKWHHHAHRAGGPGGAFYGLGFVGALIYYLQYATTIGEGIFGVLKAIVWPAIVVYRVHEWFKL